MVIFFRQKSFFNNNSGSERLGERKWVMASAYFFGEIPVAICTCGKVKMANGDRVYWSGSQGQMAAGKKMKTDGKIRIEKCCCCLGHPENLGGFSGHSSFELSA